MHKAPEFARLKLVAAEEVAFSAARVQLQKKSERKDI
jgi:hypothetical protein